MKLFLDRNKTLLPRIDVINLLIRVTILLIICWFGFLGEGRSIDRGFFYPVMVTYVLLIGCFLLGISGKFDLKLAYLASIIYDIIFLPLLIASTGGTDSSFHLFLFLTVSVAAYVLTAPFALGATVLLSGAYAVQTVSSLHPDSLFEPVLHVGLMWVCFLALSYVSKYMRRSEQRLMGLFDKLNMRTSELEKSQAQLEMMYENTRILAGILEPDGVIREVMRILGHTLQYRDYAIILRTKRGIYYYRAVCENADVHYEEKMLAVSEGDLIARVSLTDETIRVVDLAERDDYEPLRADARSVVLAPMTTHGKSVGLLMAESGEPAFFGARDEQMLQVVARSAGMALQNAELHRQTEELSIIDELTEAYNYRYFVQKLHEERKRAVRYSLPLSVVMVDIDWFKKINDSYGHEVGNVVLKTLADVIRQCVRDVDIFARYGGEEFVVILPQTPLSEAEHIGERIREQVEQTIITVGASVKLKITVSIGVSSYPENERSEEELLEAADQAMYQAKKSGKNLVCVL
ncbi:MAG: hypothetical protein DRP45_01665 [Candidatus Zixiibacteriota bacterium]|nr:MAG: hypothetical protein DRP45_01665 [candidate division Zixibacteria bacterium]